MQYKNILFITLSNIGDVILTTPVIEKIHQLHPKALIDIVGDEKSKIIFKNCPYIGSFFQKNKRKGFLELLRLLHLIRKKNYDLAIDLRSDGLLFFVKADLKYHKKNNINVHSIEKHFLSLGLGLNNIPNPRMWITEIERKAVQQFILKNNKILTIGLGANSPHKIWPTMNYAQLANDLMYSYKNVLLVGDKNDSNLGNYFMKHYNGNAINLCGKLNLIETAALIEGSDLFVGNDSGLGHIASAVGTKSYTIFGEGRPNIYKPWGNNAFWFQDPDKNIARIHPEIITDNIKKFIIK